MFTNMLDPLCEHSLRVMPVGTEHPHGCFCRGSEAHLVGCLCGTRAHSEGAARQRWGGGPKSVVTLSRAPCCPQRPPASHEANRSGAHGAQLQQLRRHAQTRVLPLPHLNDRPFPQMEPNPAISPFV